MYISTYLVNLKYCLIFLGMAKTFKYSNKNGIIELAIKTKFALQASPPVPNTIA